MTALPTAATTSVVPAAAPATRAAVDTTATGAGAAAAPATTSMAGMPGMAAPAATVKVDGTNGSSVPGRAALTNPKTGDSRFVDGTTGPQVGKNKAKTVKLQDGKAIDGGKARKQNADDKKQNNYSVTDANYNPQLGIPAKIVTEGDPKPHQPTYAETINLYSAAGYVQAFSGAEYDKMVAAQNAGGITVLEAAAMATGVIPKNAEYAKLGINEAAIPKNIPGSGLDAKKYISSGTDITGQEWARPHHALSQWGAYSQLVKLGIDGETAHTLSGDDGVSGGGRLNGVNNQDGGDSFNAGEIEIWSKAAQIEKETGKPVLTALSHSHAMTDLSPGTLTDPNINKIINGKGGVKGVATKGADARTLEAGSDREKGLLAVLTNGAVGDAKKAGKDGTKADNKKLLAGKVDPATIAAPAGGGAAPAGHDHGANAAPATSAYAAPAAAAPTSAIEQALAQLNASITKLLMSMGLSSAATSPVIGAASLTTSYAAPAAAPAPQAAAPARVATPAPQVAPAAARPVAMTSAS